MIAWYVTFHFLTLSLVLSRFKANSWHLITSDEFVLDPVNHGFTVPFSLQGHLGTDVSPSMPPMSHAERVVLSTAIDDLLRRWIVVHSHPQPGMFVSPVFTTDKKDGSHRFILNLKVFNTYVQHFHFKMESLSDMLRLTHSLVFGWHQLTYRMPILVFLFTGMTKNIFLFSGMATCTASFVCPMATRTGPELSRRC